MDILTPKGQATLADERRAVSIFMSHYGGFKYVETPKNKPADIDAFIIKNNIIIACIETKCRYDCDLNKFQNQYRNKWLITFDKIEKSRTIAKSLCVKVVGFLYLKQSDVLLFQTIVDDNGDYLPRIDIETTITKATINGGKAKRTNAYINMKDAKILKGKYEK